MPASEPAAGAAAPPPSGSPAPPDVRPDGAAVRCRVCGWWYEDVARHARRAHGLVPAAYRARFALPAGAPLAAPALAARRAQAGGERAAAPRATRPRAPRARRPVDGAPTVGDPAPAGPGAARRRAAERAAAYAALVAAGQTLGQIAAAEGITKQAVSLVLRRQGYAAAALRPPRPEPEPPARPVCAACGRPLRTVPKRRAGLPRFCARPPCRVAYHRWAYHNLPAARARRLRVTRAWQARKRGEPAPGDT